MNIRESTAAMGVRRMASLLEYSIAYCALHRIPTIEDKKEKAKQAKRAPSKRLPTEFTDVEPRAVAAIEYDEAPQ